MLAKPVRVGLWFIIRNNNAKVEPRGNAYPLDINFGGIYSPGVTFFCHFLLSFWVRGR